MNLEGVKWERINRNTHSKIRFNIGQKLFDGDSQVDNDFAMRKLWTIEKAMDIYEENELAINAEEIYKENLIKFKEKCKNGEVSINLNTISDELFFSSEAMDDFWRVVFIIHRGYETN